MPESEAYEETMDETVPVSERMKVIMQNVYDNLYKLLGTAGSWFILVRFPLLLGLFFLVCVVTHPCLSLSHRMSFSTVTPSSLPMLRVQWVARKLSSHKP